jgi:outer membrane biosynthesis protein TonB
MDDPQVAGRLMKSGASAQRARQTLRSATIPSDFHTHLHCQLLHPTSTSQSQSVGVGSSFVISPGESFSLVYNLTHSRTQPAVSGRFITPVTLTWSLTPSVNKNTTTSDTEQREEDALSALCAKLLLQPDPTSEETTKNKVVIEEVPFEHPLEWTLGIKATTGGSEQ